ncbi:MAG: 4-phosphoerythronate dehydrogenase [Ignavibacterium sp.]|nr:4-phosphoerythronate dehydrogenase [Ignavibacterium sp.]
MIKIVVDENIALADKAFSRIGDVVMISGREITNTVLKNADVLIVRSITRVDEKLLKNTSVKFVGTATIGTDHIDLDYLNHSGITFADAKGCNAYSVAEYVIAALLKLSIQLKFKLDEKSIGIVGVGNVGSKVAAFANALGMKVSLNDPPLQRKGETQKFVDLDEILKCDIITLHTPLNLTGPDKTYHLFDKEKLKRIKDSSILLNTSRGAVINNAELLDLIANKKLNVVLDVWEHEPEINIELLQQVSMGTAHIAGYSYEGKVNGTKLIYNSLCDFLEIEKSFRFDVHHPQKFKLQFNETENRAAGLNDLIKNIYSIEDDDKQMRKMLIMDKSERIKFFDLLRKNYPIRREFNNYQIHSDHLSSEMKSVLQKLRFNI